MFKVPLRNGWFVFGQNEIFYHNTGFPGVPLMVYDAEVGEFGKMITAGGLEVDPVLHPFLIVRAEIVAEHKCPRLSGCIRRLMRARAAAQERRGATINEGMAGGHPGSENTNRAEPDWDEIESGPNIRIMVLFDDSEDSDYVDHSSDGSMESDGVVSEEEEEAVETDVEVERKIVIDLTLNDSSSDCSQEL